MAPQIHTLPPEVVHLIAAGEVIDSMAAAVRELVENSLDAGATRITVSIWPEQWRVQVADNGIGIDLENLRQAATAHSTSKISNTKDLYQINTLGFRGEALHSLAQLASLEIASRPHSREGLFSQNPVAQNQAFSLASERTDRRFSAFSQAQSGWRVIYNHLGEAVEVEAVAIAPGTVVTVSNLFGNWPVRRGFTTPSQQLRAIQLTLQQIALCYPRVTWQIRQADKLWLHISPGVTAQQILPQILQGIRLSDLQHLIMEVPPLPEHQDEIFPLPLVTDAAPTQSLELVIGLPDRCHRRRPDWVKVAVNGRVVRIPELEQTILSAFSRTCPRDRYPISFIHLQIHPEQIDWNRHPAKAEIYLHNLNYWQEQVKVAIERALHLNAEGMPDLPLPERVGKLLKASEQKSAYQAHRSLQPDSESEDANNREFGLMALRAIAQVHNTYILAEHPAGMWLIEQHIAHERVLYERLCAAWQLVPLDTPVILNQLSPTQIENLQRLELEVECFGEQLWAARTAPALLAEREDCQEALIELSKVSDLQAAQVATACRSAIRNGTPLSLTEMQTLLEQWQRTRKPRTCPHGRPIFLELEESALARFFRRHWVIGKSHGI
ncbi:MAG: DNA mismatch repair endonuclease MutL [Actinomycetota bacterium]